MALDGTLAKALRLCVKSAKLADSLSTLAAMTSWNSITKNHSHYRKKMAGLRKEPAIAGDFLGGGVWKLTLSLIQLTPLKINMESKNHRIEKENHLPNLRFWVPYGSMLIFQGVYGFEDSSILGTWNIWWFDGWILPEFDQFAPLKMDGWKIHFRDGLFSGAIVLGRVNFHLEFFFGGREA